MIRKALGRLPKWERLKKIQKSKAYGKNAFENTSFTPGFNPKKNILDIIKAYRNAPKNITPSQVQTSQKLDLKKIDSENPAIVWFWHSSYLIKIDNKNILVDPVLSKNASPVSFIGKWYNGTYIYNTDDFPDIDVLVITHDHYDHLDYKTIKKLLPKVKNIVTWLGVGEHFEYRGYDSKIITELDRREATNVSGFEFTATPARHFSGRNIFRNSSLWCSFVLKSENLQIYIWWDSWYDSHFKQIWEKFGEFDLAILECGQYNEMRNNIHMMPEEVVQAWLDLHAKIVLPVHRSKFSLAIHPRIEPIQRFSTEADKKWLAYTTPMISEKIILWDKMPNSRRRE